MEKRKVTSIRVHPKKWKAVKIHCIKNDIEISDFIEQLIDRVLKKKE
jgi:hypothetical protein